MLESVSGSRSLSESGPIVHVQIWVKVKDIVEVSVKDKVRSRYPGWGKIKVGVGIQVQVGFRHGLASVSDLDSDHNALHGAFYAIAEHLVSF